GTIRQRALLKHCEQCFETRASENADRARPRLAAELRVGVRQRRNAAAGAESHREFFPADTLRHRPDLTLGKTAQLFHFFFGGPIVLKKPPPQAHPPPRPAETNQTICACWLSPPPPP